MERRFRVRLAELLDDALFHLTCSVVHYRDSNLSPSLPRCSANDPATDQRPPLRPGIALRPGQQGHRIPRLPARPRTPGFAKVDWPSRLGPSAAADRTGTPGGSGIGPSRRRAGFRPPRLSPRRARILSVFSGSGAVGWARSTTARSVFTSVTSPVPMFASSMAALAIFPTSSRLLLGMSDIQNLYFELPTKFVQEPAPLFPRQTIGANFPLLRSGFPKSSSIFYTPDNISRFNKSARRAQAVQRYGDQ